MDKTKAELTAYELRDGAYGMFLAVDGFCVDVDFGTYYYKKEDADERIKAIETRLKKVNKHLNKLRRKYKEWRSVHANAVEKCKELMTTMEANK